MTWHLTKWMKLTYSIFFVNSTTFGLEINWLICSSSELDLIIPLFSIVVSEAAVVLAFIVYIYIAIGKLFKKIQFANSY